MVEFYIHLNSHQWARPETEIYIDISILHYFPHLCFPEICISIISFSKVIYAILLNDFSVLAVSVMGVSFK